MPLLRENAGVLRSNTYDQKIGIIPVLQKPMGADQCGYRRRCVDRLIWAKTAKLSDTPGKIANRI